METTQEAPKARSPGLDHFRLNVFRLLRLPLGISREEALWKAEKSMTLARAGLPHPEPDPLKWLAPADNIELGQAAQAIEEPIKRLIDQLCWFNFPEDRDGARLSRALATSDATELGGYLRLQDLPMDESVVDERAIPIVARELNQANLRLLLGFSGLREVGPRLVQRRNRADRQPLEWRQLDGIQISFSPHEKLGDEGDGAANETLIAEGLARWGKLLRSKRFAFFVAQQIQVLRDELLSVDDVEAIVSALETRLADVLAEEMRLSMMAGAIESVALLADAAAKSGFDPKVWVLSLRPLTHLFESEVAELDPLIDEAQASVDNIELFLKRVDKLRERWRRVDSGDLLGLAELLDKAIMRAYDRLRTFEDPVGNVGDRFRTVLELAASAASSQSLKERIRSYIGTFDEYRTWSICYFCGKRQQTTELAVVVTGKKVTNVTYGFNSRTIHYAIRPAPVTRCAACANFHDFQRSAGRWAMAAAIPLPFLAVWADLPDVALFWACALAIFFAIMGRWTVRELVARWAKAHTETKDPKAHQSAVELAAQGYALMSPNYRPKALENWESHARGNISGGDWAGIAIGITVVGLLIASKAC